MHNVIVAALLGGIAGLAIGVSIATPSAAPSVEEVATRGITFSQNPRAYCERYCTAAVPGDRPRHITVEIGRGGGTAAPEGFE